MRRSAIFLLLFAPLIGCFFKFCSGISESETFLSNPYPRKSTSLNLFNSLLPPAPENDVALVVKPDGKIYMMDTNTRNFEWSFSSGPPIHSSFQNLTHFDNAVTTTADDFFVDVGEDWALYLHSNRLGKVKLSSSAEEYIRNTPYVADDGGVTLGSKRTTVFLVDAKSGKLIQTYRLADTPSTLGVQSSENDPLMKVEDADELVESGSQGLETVEQLLYIMRTDYALQHYSAGTNSVLWNVSFSEFDANFRFPNTGNALGPEDRSVSDFILPYRMKPIILRIHDPSLMESHSVFERLTEGHPGGRPLLLPAHHNLPEVPVGKIPVPPINSERREMLALPSPEIEGSRILVTDGRDAGKMNITSIMAESLTKFSIQSLFLFFITLLSIMGSIFRCSHGKQRKLKKVAEETKLQAGVPKKKKTRRLANNKKNANVEKNMSNMLYEYKVGEPNESTHSEKSEKKFLLTSTDFGDGQVEGRRIGKLLVSNNEIAKGSNGTIVLEGIYDGRPVAVKRLVRTHHDVAGKEIQNLIASDQHPNIVRWYGVEYDQDFVYLSLERCACSLNDLIYFYSESFQSQLITKDQDPHFLTEYTIRLHSMMDNNKDVELWKANGYPSPQLLKLMSDLVSGLAHLHELGIIHRDLKPQNVLIIKGKSLCAKLSDMGISKRLQGDQSSITQHATGYGSSGWQAPEQLLHQRQTRAVDLFSLGCLLFFCVTGGKHPYGDSIERDVNIVNDRKDLFLVETIPEAVDLFTRLLDPNPDMRPTAVDVLHHPFFWNSETRLSFLRDASDRVELEDRENSSELLNSLENTATVALNGKWDEKMESAFINNIGRYRRYKFDSVRDLLRVIRNKLNHYRELPQEIQEILGPVPEGFDSYFSSRFPSLLIEVYKVLYSYCKEEKFLCKYIKSNRM